VASRHISGALCPYQELVFANLSEVGFDPVTSAFKSRPKSRKPPVSATTSTVWSRYLSFKLHGRLPASVLCAFIAGRSPRAVPVPDHLSAGGTATLPRCASPAPMMSHRGVCAPGLDRAFNF
jgi:hypothetical protein